MPLWRLAFLFLNGILFLLEKMGVGLKPYLFDVSLQTGKVFDNFSNNLVLQKTELLAIGRMVRDDGEGFSNIFYG